jgi:hypothetical protein
MGSSVPDVSFSGFTLTSLATAYSDSHDTPKIW